MTRNIVLTFTLLLMSTLTGYGRGGHQYPTPQAASGFSSMLQNEPVQTVHTSLPSIYREASVQSAVTVRSQAMTLAEHNIRIEGTSNVRDWEAVLTQVTAEAAITFTPGQPLNQLTPDQFKKVRLEIPVKDIETDTGRLTRNIHKYLEIDRQPVITFELTGVQSIEGNSETVRVIADGVVSAAGESHPITLQAEITRESDGSLTISGVQELKMTDFGISPPTAMLGTIRAVDELQVIYMIRLNPGELSSNSRSPAQPQLVTHLLPE